MQQPSPIFTATQHGIFINSLPLTKSFSQNVSPQARRYIARAEELLKKLKPEDWNNHTPHDPQDIPVLAKAQILLALASPQPMEAFYKYRPDQARVPAGNPDGGQWEDESGIASTTTNSSSSNTQQTLDTIRNGVQTKQHGVVKPVSTNTDSNGKPVNQVNIFIGGALDQRAFGNVKNSGSLNYSLGSNYYFTYADKDKINDFIDNAPDSTAINVIGHSWGGDTAARVALDNPDAIDNLITIDPVSTFLPRPDLSQVANNVGNWVNVNATGHGGPFAGFINGNVAAGFGAWNEAPNGIVNSFITAQYPHAYFSNMMDMKDSKTNQSPQEIIGIGTPEKK